MLPRSPQSGQGVQINLDGHRRAGAAHISTGQVIGSEARVAVAAIDQRITEMLKMPRRDLDPRIGDDCRFDADDVVALLHHRLPPASRMLRRSLDPERAVVLGVGEAAVDSAPGKTNPRRLQSETMVSIERPACRRLLSHGRRSRWRQ